MILLVLLDSLRQVRFWPPYVLNSVARTAGEMHGSCHLEEAFTESAIDIASLCIATTRITQDWSYIERSERYLRYE